MADEPKRYDGVMVSSTFTDLKEHRGMLLHALNSADLKPVAMEYSGASAGVDVIASSLGFVRDAAAYIAVISHKYGQTPDCPTRNPDMRSITELEFDEAIRLDRPILLFVMSKAHPITIDDAEPDPEKREKLKAFVERAKVLHEGSAVERIYETFDSKEDFARKAERAVQRLATFLERQASGASSDQQSAETESEEPTLPVPPELRALPRYIGSHEFVGRASELQTLDEWAGEADPDPMLLFEAIGGSGKSMLTWEWVNNSAVAARDDWAGRFWYSFYERGALMTDFCREALAYMTGQPLEDFSELRIRDLSEQLIQELEQRPWLLVLDGLERVLVAYHRIDAAQLRDEEVDTAEDQIAKRHPCVAIRPEDDELIQRLAAVRSSKILITSRLTPRALINPSSQPLPGVRREFLSGLRPADAEAMMRRAKIRGDSKAIQDYLQKNCRCHPLVVGALAGLINDYIPDPGHFDVWADAPDGGLALNLGNVSLVKRREHILDAAIQALSPQALKLLQTLALLQRGADYELLTALNPYLPDDPSEVDDPARSAAARSLNETIRDLERRGLLQYERGERRYDLHPVVRGVAAGRMRADEKKARGEQVVSYFMRQSPGTWDDADSLDDLAPGLQFVATLTQLGRLEEAFRTYRGSLANALFYNCEAYAEILALLRPFFPQGWDGDNVSLSDHERTILINDAAFAFADIDSVQAQRLFERKLRLSLAIGDTSGVCITLLHLNVGFLRAGKAAQQERTLSLALDLAKTSGDEDDTFGVLFHLFAFARDIGDDQRADRFWMELDSMGRNWNRFTYRPGGAETAHAFNRWRRGDLTENELVEAERLARSGRNRQDIRRLAYLRGRYHMERDEAGKAGESLSKAVRMAREVGSESTKAEACYALARLRAGESFDARFEAERLDGKEDEAALDVAELWRELDEPERAIAAALRAHNWAVADGKPYVYRHLLDRTRTLLEELGADLPEVPDYDPARNPTFDWEADIRKMIEELKAERAKRDGETD